MTVTIYTIYPGCGAPVHHDRRIYADYCPRYPCLLRNRPGARPGLTPTEVA